MEKHNTDPQPQTPDHHDVSRRTLLRTAGGSVVTAAVLGGGLSEVLNPHIEPEGDPVTAHTTVESHPIKKPENMLSAGNWDCMAGAEQQHDGSLKLTPVGATIKNKREDGKRQENPPLNIFGPHLEVDGDFMVSAAIKSNKPVSLQVYGQPPLPFDDFRYERSRIELLTAGNVLSIRIWDGTSQEPNVAPFHFTGPTTDREVAMRLEGEKITFRVNDNDVTSIQGIGKLFGSGEVWFGLNSEQGKATVSKLMAGPINGHSANVVDTSTLRLPPSNQPHTGMAAELRRPGFTFGAAFSPKFALTDPIYAQIMMGGDVHRWTTENCLKPQAVQPKEGIFDFSKFDMMVQLAQQAKFRKEIHGHVLMYTKALPEWMETMPTATEADKQHVRDVLVNHITTTVKYCKSKGVKSYDVVNELVTGFNQDAKTDTNNVFYKALGEEWIFTAFQAAYDADPEGKFYIAENGIETNPERADVLFGLVDRLQARGIPIHGINDQCHVYKMNRDEVKPRVLINLAKRAHDRKLEFNVSELDVVGDDTDAQIEQYMGVVGTGLHIPNMSNISFWGLADSYGSTVSLKNNRLKPGNALLYTASGKPKAAYKHVLQTIREVRGFYDFS